MRARWERDLVHSADCRIEDLAELVRRPYRCRAGGDGDEKADRERPHHQKVALSVIRFVNVLSCCCLLQTWGNVQTCKRAAWVERAVSHALLALCEKFCSAWRSSSWASRAPCAPHATSCSYSCSRAPCSCSHSARARASRSYLSRDANRRRGDADAARRCANNRRRRSYSRAAAGRRRDSASHRAGARSAHVGGSTTHRGGPRKRGGGVRTPQEDHV